MINNIMIIYIEGYNNQQPKQEKYLFQHASESRYIWNKYFEKMSFKNFLFQTIPKKFTNDNKKKYYKILDQKISFLLSSKKNKKFLYLLITGDHDENNDQELKCREKIANEIKNNYKKNKKIILIKILLTRNKNFNLETIMSEIVGEKVTKKELKIRIKNKYPTIFELMKFPNKKKLKEEEIINNLINSKHILFKEISNIKNKINKK